MKKLVAYTKQFKVVFQLWLFLLISFPQSVFSQQLVVEPPLIKGFRFFLETLIFIVFALALVFFSWGLAMSILKSENEEERNKGKQKMLWGIIGFAVMIGIWGIINVILLAFGLDFQWRSSIQSPFFPKLLP